MSQKTPEKYEEKLWRQWTKKKDDQIANELVQIYMYLVTFHVERVAVNLPPNVNKDDLESYALMGLFDALNKFEVDRDLKFNTYASYRIRGAIFDGLRREDWLPRSLRDQVKRVETVSDQLEQQFNQTPSAEEIAAELDITSEEVETLFQHSLFSHVLSIDDHPTTETNDDSEDMQIMIEDDQEITPDEQIIKQESIQFLIQEIKTLNKNEQLVISLFYYDELTMTEIGEVLDLTTSRISQIHRKALFKLRKALQKPLQGEVINDYE